MAFVINNYKNNWEIRRANREAALVRQMSVKVWQSRNLSSRSTPGQLKSFLSIVAYSKVFMDQAVRGSLIGNLDQTNRGNGQRQHIPFHNQEVASQDNKTDENRSEVDIIDETRTINGI